MKVPSCLLQDLRWRTTIAGITFLRRSGFPFLTVAKTISPSEAAGSRFKHEPVPLTAMIYRFFPPLLSQQFITAPTFRPRVTLSLFPPAPPLPLFILRTNNKNTKHQNNNNQ
eukprot:GHVS01034138.1.p2 GENE.GHVS01034138.1~~GHVS01034138.1.p2  ORF type:complete len:112 (-),score=12.16 GHVS01034138.1:81-416(-)